MANLKSEFINHLQTLRDMATNYKSQITELATTDPQAVIALQDELLVVTELIASTEEELKEIRITLLKNSRELLEKDKTNPRYNEMDAKLNTLGYGGRRKTRKHRKRR